MSGFQSPLRNLANLQLWDLRKTTLVEEACGKSSMILRRGIRKLRSADGLFSRYLTWLDESGVRFDGVEMVASQSRSTGHTFRFTRDLPAHHVCAVIPKSLCIDTSNPTVGTSVRDETFREIQSMLQSLPEEVRNRFPGWNDVLLNLPEDLGYAVKGPTRTSPSEFVKGAAERPVSLLLHALDPAIAILADLEARSDAALHPWAALWAHSANSRRPPPFLLNADVFHALAGVTPALSLDGDPIPASTSPSVGSYTGTSAPPPHLSAVGCYPRYPMYATGRAVRAGAGSAILSAAWEVVCVALPTAVGDIFSGRSAGALRDMVARVVRGSMVIGGLCSRPAFAHPSLCCVVDALPLSLDGAVLAVWPGDEDPVVGTLARSRIHARGASFAQRAGGDDGEWVGSDVGRYLLTRRPVRAGEEVSVQVGRGVQDWASRLVLRRDFEAAVVGGEGDSNVAVDGEGGRPLDTDDGASLVAFRDLSTEEVEVNGDVGVTMDIAALGRR